MKLSTAQISKLLLMVLMVLIINVEVSSQTLNDDGTIQTIDANGLQQHLGSAQDYIIPSGTAYNSISFTLRGGDGGYAKAGSACKSNGGEGATTEVEFLIGTGAGELEPGGTIRIIVGKYGENSEVGGTNNTTGAGGGGTSVLYRPTGNQSWIILAVAGGGGGAHQGNFLGGCINNQLGQGGQSTEIGSDGEGNNAGSGGTNGEAGGYGLTLLYGGYGGGGAFSSAEESGGGQGFPNGGYGGQAGANGGFGFGGGGASGLDGGGGGGGYSGGGGAGGSYDNGGGGGSYVNPSYAISSSKMAGAKGGGNSQNGHVDYIFQNTIFQWTGDFNDDWNHGNNWTPNRVPRSIDIVNINPASRNPVVRSSNTAHARVVRVFNGGVLNVFGELNLYPKNSNGISNYGSILNSGGTINISRYNSQANNDGILNEGGDFSNSSSGVINIYGMDRYGIYNTASATFNNSSGSIINVGTVSEAIENDGILNEAACTFTNFGTLNVRNIGGVGIYNNGNFTNYASGNILVDQVTTVGIGHLAGVFQNSGTLNIGSIASIVNDGIQSHSTFTNNSGAEIIIDRAYRGLFTVDGTFTNEGLIDIGKNENISSLAILNGNSANPVFLNSSCDAVINIQDGGISDSENSFTNSGTIIQQSSESSNVQTNNGVIFYNAGVFTSDIGNVPFFVSGNISDKKFWTGCAGNGWANDQNWYPIGVPVATDQVVIHPIGTTPLIPSTKAGNAKYVYVEDGAALTNNGSLNISDGPLRIEPGATVGGNGQYDVGGAFEVYSGTFNPGSSTVTLSGLTTVNIGNDPVTFYNLVIDKPSDQHVGLISEVTVTNELTINSGDLDIYGFLGGSLTCPHLYLPNGSDLLNNGELTLTAGAFWIQSGSSSRGNGHYSVSGNFVVDGGTFTPGTSTVTMNGTGHNSISPNPVGFYNLTINKASNDITLGGSITIDNELKMTSGNLNLNGLDIELIGNGTIIGESTTSYIYSSSGGVVKKTLDLNAPSSENPGNIGVTITSSSNLGMTTIQRGHEAQDVIGVQGILRYYDISPDNNSGLNASVRFNYLDHELNGTLEGDLIPYRFNGADWDNFHVSANDASANWVETQNLNAFSKWTLACSFEAYYADNDGDGYGDPEISIRLCEPTIGYVANNSDCNDNDPNVNPNPDCSSATRTWTGHINSDWEEPCNWSPNCVPTPNDNIIIPDVPNNPVISDMISAVAQSVTIQELAELTINNGGTLTINATSNGIVNNGVVTNNGEINITGGAKGLVSNSQLINNSGATINITNNADYCLSINGNGSLTTNNGTINCYGTGGTGLLIFNGTLDNLSSGIINILGSFEDYGIFNAGSTIQDGTVLIDGALDIGFYVFGPASSFINSGTLITQNIGGRAVINSTNATFTNTGVFQGEGIYQLLGHSLGGTVVPGSSTGIMNYLGDQSFEAIGTIDVEIDGTTPGTEHDQIVVEGNATIGGTLNIDINYTPTKGDRIVLLSASDILGTFSTVSPSLPYDWSLDYSVPGEVALVYDYTIGVWDGAAEDGEWTNPFNWQGRMLPGASDAVVISNGDAVTLTSGSQTVLRIVTSGGSNLEINAGAVLNVNNNAGDALNANCSSCILTNYGEINISGGARGLVTSSQLINNSGATINITNNTNNCLSINGNGSLATNNGTINCYGTAGTGLVIYNGTLDNQSSGIINILGSFEDHGILITGSMIQDGTVLIDGSLDIGFYVFGSTSSFINSGTLITQNIGGRAILNSTNSTFMNTGVFQGEGIYQLLNHSLDGAVVPGSSAGTMTFQGDQVFAASGVIQMEVNGTIPDIEHDQIIVEGIAAIGGSLDVSINFTPTNGDRIVLLSAGSIVGTFSGTNPALPLDWSLDYNVPGEVAIVYGYVPGRWDGDAGDGEWNNPLNWSGNVLPGPDDIAYITNGDQVRLSSGTVNVKGIHTSGGSELIVVVGAGLHLLSQQ